MEKNFKDFEKIIKYTFKKTSLIEKSLTHKSFNNEINNEKLEFLGDRVLGLVISEKLLEKYPHEKEGIIDKKFANLVNKKTCCSIAKINLKKFIFLGASYKKMERSTDKIISDCLEAIVGAIYLDGGLKAAEKFILNFWDEYLLKSSVTLIDSKTKLQEFSLKNLKNFLNISFLRKWDLNINRYLKRKYKYRILKRYPVRVPLKKKPNKMLQQNFLRF